MPERLGEQFQMRQLFQNLVSNGLKYHKKTEPPLVRIHHQSSQDGMAEIWVEDNGKGFDEKHAERIFRPFERLHAISEYGGTGMGLAICRKIIEHHSGAISAKSAPDKGSTFIIKIPANKK